MINQYEPFSLPIIVNGRLTSPPDHPYTESELIHIKNLMGRKFKEELDWVMDLTMKGELSILTPFNHTEYRNDKPTYATAI